MTIDVKKGAQIGLSTMIVALALFLPACAEKNVGYFLPDNTFAKRFDETRVLPVIKKNPWLSSLVAEEDAKNKPGLTGFGTNFRYTLGLETVRNAISIPLDAALYDEVDEIPADNKEWSADRLQASDLRLQMNFSVGMIPGAGIDELYNQGSGRKWLVKCPACNRDDQVLEDVFPDCIEKVGDEWARVCVYCGAPYDVQTAGRWVAERPEREKDKRYSFQIPALIVPQVSLDWIMAQWQRAQGKKSRLAKFNCSILARVDAGELQPITNAVLDPCWGEAAMTLTRGTRPRFAGVDTGDQVWLYVRELMENGRPRTVWVEEIDSDQMEAVLTLRKAQLGIVALVIDAKPLRSEARRLAYADPRRVWLQDFIDEGEMRTADGEHEGHTFQRVVVPRTDSLLDTCDEFTTGDESKRMVMPRLDARSPDVLRTAAVHLKGLQKVRMLDAKGSTVERFRRDVPNHLGMACNSSRIAAYLAGAAADTKPPVVSTGVSRATARLLEGFGA